VEDLMAEVTAEIVTQLKEKYPNAELLELSSVSATVIAKVPGMGEARQLRENTQDPKMAGKANEIFVRSCILWPEQVQVQQLLEKRPGLIEVWSKPLAEAAGMVEEIKVKKL
jgi:hypothetical protein